MESNKDQKEHTLKSILQKIYSAFNTIYNKLNSIFDLNNSKLDSKTPFPDFTKMQDLQNPLSKAYHNFASGLKQSLNSLFSAKTDKQITQNRSIIPNRKSISEKGIASTSENISLFEKALKSIELTENSELNTVISRAREFKGTSLTNDENSMTERILELIKPQQFFSNIMESNSKILTNSLTARGGFQGGAVMPGKDSVQRSINSKVDKIKEIMDEIKKLQSEMKDTVEKGLKV